MFWVETGWLMCIVGALGVSFKVSRDRSSGVGGAVTMNEGMLKLHISQ